MKSQRPKQKRTKQRPPISDPSQWSGSRVLLLDDNPDDRALVRRELQRALPSLMQVEEITDASRFDRALQDRPADLVITDYQLRWTDGLSVLRQVKQLWPQSSVVMFTGTGSEEIAVEAMKSGLDDYILKSPLQYARLAAASQVALRAAQHRQQLHGAERRYRELVETLPVGLFRADSSGNMEDANPALLEMLGYPLSTKASQLHLPDLFCDPKCYQQWLNELRQSGTVRHFEAQLKCASGGTTWALLHARALYKSNGVIETFEAAVEDITDQKSIEQEREQLIVDLQDALAKIRTLSGFLPICASCKKIRDDGGYWNQIEVFIESHSDAEFTHSFCPECVRRLYPELNNSSELSP